MGGLFLILLFAYRGLAVSLANADSAADLLPATAAYVVSPLALLAIRWLQVPTPAGRAIKLRIEGFRQYLAAYHLNPLAQSPQLFERFLPYPIALDLESDWAKGFAGVLAAATGGDSSPLWSDWGYGAPEDAADMGRVLSKEIAAATAGGGGGFGGGDAGGSGSGGSAGGGGGSGGGGASGDGGGGGGGGGW